MYFNIIALFLFILINNCLSLRQAQVFKILERNNDILLEKDDGEYDPNDVSAVIKNYADIEYNLGNILNRAPVDKLVNNPLGSNRQLVKRVVPTGKETPNLEYDEKRGTYFKPLVKIHKVKKVEPPPDFIVSNDCKDCAEIYSLPMENQNDFSPFSQEDSQEADTENDPPDNFEHEGALFFRDIEAMKWWVSPKKQRLAKRKIKVIVEDLGEIQDYLINELRKAGKLGKAKWNGKSYE